MNKSKLFLLGFSLCLMVPGMTFAEEQESAIEVADPANAFSIASPRTASPAAPALDAFGKKYAGQWKLRTGKGDGKVNLLYGHLSKTYTGEASAVASAFLKEEHALFGLKADLADVRLLRTDKTEHRHHTRLQQTINGIPVEGAEIRVHSTPDGQVSMVQNSYVPDIQVQNQERLDAEQAKQIARHDLAAKAVGTLADQSGAHKKIVRHQGQYRYVWEINTSTRDPFAYWIYRIDAESGSILYQANEIHSLQTGLASIYRSNARWIVNKLAKGTLRSLFTTGDGYGHDTGFLWGLHADVWDDNGQDPFSATLDFRYDPLVKKDYFDAAQAYYSMNVIWIWWDRNVVRKYNVSDPDWFYDYSMPTFVNVIGMCNAFYSPDIWGDNSYEPGFAFGDENACASGSEDLALDSDVFRHEYAHAMMDWSGFDDQYGGDLDGYGRAMGEGNADWYAYVESKDPVMAEVAFNWTAEGYLRNLDNTRTYPDDVDFPDWGVPEEHYTGEIWGAYLYDVYQQLKTKSIPYVYQSGYYFSVADGHRDGAPDFFDALLAQVLAEQDLTGKMTSTAKAWGSMASRGLNGVLRNTYSHNSDYFASGIAGADDAQYFAFNLPAVTSISTKSRLLENDDVHEYIINVTVPNLDLTVTVTGKTKGMINPDINLLTVGGAPVGTMTSTDGIKATLTYVDLPAGTYVITVEGTQSAPSQGAYQLKLAVQ